jgi:hypothetical protein
MSGGGGKGGEQTTEIKLPKDIEAAAKDNLELAKKVGSLPYAPYMGASVAGFQPAQEAAFKGADAAASAFGLPGAAAGAMPKPDVNTGGFSGYSTKPFYDQAMAQVDPAVLKLYNSFFYPNNTAAVAAPAAAAAAPQKRNSAAAFK